MLYHLLLLFACIHTRTISINDKFHKYMEYNVRDSQKVLYKYTPVSLRNTLDTKVIAPLLKDIKSLKVDDVFVFQKIKKITQRLKYNYKSVIYKQASRGKLRKRAVSRPSFSDDDVQVREWEGAIMDRDSDTDLNFFDALENHDDLGRLEGGDLVDGDAFFDAVGDLDNAHEENPLREGYKMLQEWIDPKYYYNWVEGNIYLMQNDVHERYQKFFRSVGRNVAAGFGEEISRFLDSEIMDQFAADFTEKVQNSVPDEFKDHTIMQNVRNVAHNSGNAAGLGLIQALKDSGTTGDFHVEAAHESGKAAVRGVFQQIFHYGAIGFLICLPFIVLLAAVRFFEMYIYEANDYAI